jgi:hypothetical protein
MRLWPCPGRRRLTPPWLRLIGGVDAVVPVAVTLTPLRSPATAAGTSTALPQHPLSRLLVSSTELGRRGREEVNWDPIITCESGGPLRSTAWLVPAR